MPDEAWLRPRLASTKQASTPSRVCGRPSLKTSRRAERVGVRGSGQPEKRVCWPKNIRLVAVAIVVKNCSKCGIEKPVAEFSSRGGSQTHLRRSWCKTCSVRVHKKWCDENPKKVEEYRGRDPWTLAKRCNRYGISPAEFVEAYEAQDGKCLVCYNHISQMDSAIDHNHKTGEFRGILCKKCNRAIGMLQDSPTVLRRAAEYLETKGNYGDGT